MRTLFTLIIAVAPAYALAADEPVTPAMAPQSTGQSADDVEDEHIGPFDVPRFDHGGLLISIQWGGTGWGLDLPGLEAQTGGFSRALTNQLQTSPANLGIRLVGTIKGFVTVGGEFAATGWEIFNSTRGGAGFVSLIIGVNPLQFFFLKKKGRPLGVDVLLYGGGGYGIVGTSGPPALGMDGPVGVLGMNIDYFFTKNFGIGFFARNMLLSWGTFYTDWDGAHSNPPSPGSAARISTNPTIGNWWHAGLGLILRVGD